MNLLIQKIREALKENIDEKTQKNSQRFFKEKRKSSAMVQALQYVERLPANFGKK
jgi:hypothetical protein